MICFIYRWRVIDIDFPSKYDIKNNGIVRRDSQDSDVSIDC